MITSVQIWEAKQKCPKVPGSLAFTALSDIRLAKTKLFSHENIWQIQMIFNDKNSG